MELKQVHQTLKNLMYIEDDCKSLDLLLATQLSRTQKHSKIWIILVAETGYGKSELTRAFTNEHTKHVRKLTPATLVSGKNDKGQYDLALQLKDKTLIINDLAQILKLPTETKAQLFAQLVDLYDGIASTNAYGVNKHYENLNVTFIGCSTYAIQSQFLLFSYLGTRFLCYGMNINNRHALLNKIKENLDNQNKTQLRQEYQKAVNTFLKEHKYTHHKIEPHIQKEIETWGDMLTKLRITGNTENTSGELTEIPHDELPTRIIEQLTTIYRSLKSLDKNYTDKRAMTIIKNLVLSSSNRLRIKLLTTAIIKQITTDKPFTRKEIAQELGMGFKQIYRELNFLAHTKLIEKITLFMGHDNQGEEIYHHKWQINNKHENIQLLIKYIGIKTKQILKEQIIEEETLK